jgi:hypothetical protein
VIGVLSATNSTTPTDKTESRPVIDIDSTADVLHDPTGKPVTCNRQCVTCLHLYGAIGNPPGRSATILGGIGIPSISIPQTPIDPQATGVIHRIANDADHQINDHDSSGNNNRSIWTPA